MRTFIWSLLKNLFHSEITALCNEYHQKMTIENKLNAITVNLPLGSMVIVRSNEPNPLLIGKVIDHKLVGKSLNSLLIGVKDRTTGNIFYTMNTPAHWSAERESALSKLDWAEQYNVMNKNVTISIEDQKDKESPGYLNRLGCSCVKVHTLECTNKPF